MEGAPRFEDTKMRADDPQAFWDSTGKIWASGGYAGKYAGVFVSTSSPGGGQETTIINSLSTLTHHGIIYVPLGYSQTFALLTDFSEVHGGEFVRVHETILRVLPTLSVHRQDPLGALEPSPEQTDLVSQLLMKFRSPTFKGNSFTKLCPGSNFEDVDRQLLPCGSVKRDINRTKV